MFHTIVGFASNSVTKYRVHVVIETLVEVSVTVEVTLEYASLHMLSPA